MANVERRWMYDRAQRGVIPDSFIQGVETFLEFAKRQVVFQETSTIRCPCRKCKNLVHQTTDDVRVHLYRSGFIDNYHCWTCHGEKYGQQPAAEASNVGQFVSMAVDGLAGWENSDDEDEDEEPNAASRAFFDMLAAAQEPLYEGSTVTLLEMASQLINIKCEYNLPHRCVDAMAALMCKMIPDKNVMTKTFYQTKKVLKALQMPHSRIHCCPNGCMLFWGSESELLDKCAKCGSDRWRRSSRGKKIPKSELIYFPITPRLQRLYATQATAEQMRWHSKHVCGHGKMAHPSDSEAWRHFDLTYPEFAAAEERNVRLGLCTDGFAAYGKFEKPYSCWPVILTPYNLPPWMCMKREFMFLSMIIPGPKSPKGNLHVYMQPLIRELQTLWNPGALTYDVSTKKDFSLRAAIIWTISDFPAYGMLSAWPTAGKTACPVCMHQNKGFWLMNGKKISWFDTHRQFLPTDHPFRSNKTHFLRNRVDRCTPPRRLGADEIISNEHTSKVLQSIFWELPYWSSLLIRHNLDVMHIEKNVFEQLIHTVLDVKGRTVDTMSARKDIALYCRRRELDIVVDGRGKEAMPNAPYVLEKAQRKALCEWVMNLKFPDGYASDFSRCVDVKECKLFGMKSHDCHVFMERLVPVAFKHLLLSNIWKACTEISLFFRELCSSTIHVDDMVRLEKQIPEIICKLEKIFPPSFFNSMEHLPVHLPFEARVGGPVQFRWMYPFERFLNHLKKKIGNKARVEGSICNAYLLEEISTFCTHYFGEDVDTKSKDLPRNVHLNSENDELHLPELFRSNGGRSFHKGKSRFLDDKEHKRAHLYVLGNCGILSEFETKFEDHILQLHPETVHDQVWIKYEERFPDFLRDYVINVGAHDDLVYSMAMGLARRVKTFNKYCINGFSFHTIDYGKNKGTMNYGVSVEGHDMVAYYGILEEVIEMTYTGRNRLYTTILFKCSWMDPGRGTKVHELYKLVEVNHTRKYPKYDPFVLAHQVNQVYFLPYPAVRRDIAEWWAVFKTKSRSVIDAPLDPLDFQEESGEFPHVLADLEDNDQVDPFLGGETDVLDDATGDAHEENQEFEDVEEYEEEQLDDDEAA